MSGFHVAGAVLAFAVLAGAASAADTASIDRGRDAFMDECIMCHQVVPGEGGTQGPALNGVVGRKAGSVPGFNYTKAMKSKTHLWTRKNLDIFLSDPPEFVPGTAMPVNVGDAQERADLIAFLATTK